MRRMTCHILIRIFAYKCLLREYLNLRDDKFFVDDQVPSVQLYFKVN